MGDEPSRAGRPTTLMRLGLGLVIGLCALIVGGAAVALLSLVLAAGLFVAAAVALAHTGGLDAAVFARAQVIGVVSLAAFLIVAYVYRASKRTPSGAVGRAFALLTRSPLATVAVVLPAASFLSIRAALSGYPLPDELPAALIFDDLYFFTTAAVVIMIAAVVYAARGLYRWASAGRYRSGVVTALLGVLLVLLAAAGYRRSPPPYDVASSTSPSRIAPSAFPTTQRELFVFGDELVEPKGARPSAPLSESDDVIGACVRDLVATQVPQVKRYIQNRYVFSDGDAHDVVYDALLAVCEAHVRKRYESLGAVLQTAADRRAQRWRNRRLRYCPYDDSRPSCEPSADEVVRFEREDRVIVAALCAEDDETLKIIYMRAIEDWKFPEIGKALGLSADVARARWQRARERVEGRLVEFCGR